MKNEIDIHFLPNQILEWLSMPEIPSNALKVFIEERIDLIIDELKENIEE
ncbi:MAG: hypothetical protein GQ564_11890 [Bacteroidales bacterium]|nr:hypothetical protein [Bacteroidales bacterium]